MHWSHQYVGLPYVHGEADCARLVCKVRREVFRQPVPDGAEIERAASAYGRAVQAHDGVTNYGTKVETPEEGDMVLMTCRGRPSHIGVFCRIDGEAYVLHAMSKPGQAVLSRIRDLGRILLAVEGYYRWK